MEDGRGKREATAMTPSSGETLIISAVDKGKREK